MSSTRRKIISFFVVLSLLFAPLASSAGIAIAGLATQDDISESQLQLVIFCHEGTKASAADCENHAAPSAKLSAEGLHGCCIGFAAVLPTAIFSWLAQGADQVHQVLVLRAVPPLRTEAIYRPPRQNS